MRHRILHNQPRYRYMAGLGSDPATSSSESIATVTLRWYDNFTTVFRSVTDDFSISMEALLFQKLVTLYGGAIARAVCTMPKADFDRESSAVISQSGIFDNLSKKEQALACAFTFLRAFRQVSAEKGTDAYFVKLANAIATTPPKDIYDLYLIICNVDSSPAEPLDDLFGVDSVVTATADVSVFTKAEEMNQAIFNSWRTEFEKDSFSLSNFIENYILKYILVNEGEGVLASVVNTPFTVLAKPQYNLAKVLITKATSWSKLSPEEKYLLLFAVWRDRLADWRASAGNSPEQKAYLDKLYDILNGVGLASGATIQNMLNAMIAVPLPGSSTTELTPDTESGDDVGTDEESFDVDEPPVEKEAKKSNKMLYLGLTAGVLILGTVVGLAIRKSNKNKK